MIRKGQVRWLAKGDIVGQGAFAAGLLGLGAAAQMSRPFAGHSSRTRRTSVPASIDPAV